MMESGVAHLYEHRGGTYTVAAIQLGVFVLSFIFTYVIWWQGILGIFVASCGLYAASEPVVRQKQTFASLYYYCSILLLLVCVLDAALFLWIMLSVAVVGNDNVQGMYSYSPAWWWVTLVLGSALLLFHIALTSTGISRAASYRSEMLRNPPPEVLVVYQAVPPVQQRMEVKAM